MGERAIQALRGTREGRVKRYLDLWVVIGDEEYVVEGSFCTCPDYFFNVSSSNPSADRCWHAMAVEAAVDRGEFDEVDEYYHHFMGP
ncbi:MAG: hypothetical protein MAG715_00720 [Methanonatronarchaeales archaeon]|nr:hypothetical protein [Methanonatronarchaeales archaeon]